MDNLTVKSGDDLENINPLKRKLEDSALMQEQENPSKQEKKVLIPKKYIPLSSIDGNKVEPNNCSLIVFDFETSGMSTDFAEILQIAAVFKEKEFDVYIKPQGPIEDSASSVNHLKLIDDVLCYHNKPVESTTLYEAVTSFLSWIESIPPPRILIGHNVKGFDCKFLRNALDECEMLTRFSSSVIGFIDTMTLSRRRWPGMKNYKQNTLVQAILDIKYEEHNAIEDVRSLQKLISSVSIDDAMYLDCSFTSDSTWEYIQYSRLLKERMYSYQLMIYKKGIPKSVAERLACNNIFYNNLNAAYKNGGKEELMALLGQEVDGKIIGTVRKNHVDQIIEHLEEI